MRSESKNDLISLKNTIYITSTYSIKILFFCWMVTIYNDNNHPVDATAHANNDIEKYWLENLSLAIWNRWRSRYLICEENWQIFTMSEAEWMSGHKGGLCIVYSNKKIGLLIVTRCLLLFSLDWQHQQQRQKKQSREKRKEERKTITYKKEKH